MPSPTRTADPDDFTAEFMPFAALRAEIAAADTPLRAAITAAYRRDERDAVRWLQAQPHYGATTRQAARNLARELVQQVRARRSKASGVDALMHEFSLSSDEGIALMCLAEALLRIPDVATADRLIADKISRGDWARHLGESPSLFVNAATWGLLVTGKLIGSASEHGLSAALTRLIARGGEPLIRKGMDLAMRMLGNQFVTGQTIAEALDNSRANEARGYRYSYDMLGEAALTGEDAAKYFAAYEDAIHAIGRGSAGRGIKQGPGISVKLSALHPRYVRAQRERVLRELLPRLKTLAVLASEYNIGLNIDAEEADRLELSLDLMEALAFDVELDGFEGLGFVVQAYQKRCPFVIDFLADLAHRSGRKFMVRLVKGAYWDAEIKRAQVDGMPGYPVFTRKLHTDMSYLVCAQKLLAHAGLLYPQFATHNAHTVASVYCYAKERGITDYEFQCLHGMGETLYDQVVGADHLDVSCRIYAPVGSHQTLLAYLVRRLLENGANSSFVNQIVDGKIAVDALIADPFEQAEAFDGAPHPAISLPSDLFGAARKNSAGIDLSDESTLQNMAHAFEQFGRRHWHAAPLLAGAVSAIDACPILNPADRRDTVGQVIEAQTEDADTALAAAHDGAAAWQATAPAQRAAILARAADLLEQHHLELMTLLIREAGKSLPNAVAEVREAVDFLRYYGAQVRDGASMPALGLVACISPWNFPLAIFIGQVSAALAAGNVVLAKPAEQTPLIAHRAVLLLHAAGVPRDALQLLPGRGEIVGARLTADPRVAGVIFTGSTEVAQLINRTLAQRSVTEAREIPLIAETGGQNAMIVDSSALIEQVVQDVLASAFDSAGQRCSALRVLFLQSEIADRALTMLHGAMHELHIGSPDRLATDVGPVIDEQARQALLDHIERLSQSAKSCHQLPLGPRHDQGTFVAPTVLEINSLAELQQEVFGPVLHVIRFRRDELPRLVDAINASGYGLTLGVHSRLDETADFISSHAHVGNIYVNRNIVGAVVGVQPFGGEGKSGTGPKAGGPLYLKRLQRNPVASESGLDLAAHETSDVPALMQLRKWAVQHDHSALAHLCATYAKDSLFDKFIVLPGPTGERNTLCFAPRGVVLCAACDRVTLLNQLAAAFACGNRVALLSTTAPLIPGDLPAEVRSRIRLVEWANIAQEEIHVALIDATPFFADLPVALATRDGAIVPVIRTDQNQQIPVWRLTAERALCVNTTAAGGNASLMTLEDPRR
jgi:RHH-type proline utilization regulon transcriptional repressor/proline dehydrogenase/delta 1-pyrroline-5-carboxylate dehydrogenase